jgi:hypothetical protein
MMPSIPPEEKRTGSASQRPPLPERQPPLVRVPSAGAGPGAVVYCFGALVWVIGLLLVIGNITGIFRTFPFAGFLTTFVGFLIQGWGNAILRTSHQKMQIEVFSKIRRQQALESSKREAPPASRIGTDSAALQEAIQDRTGIPLVGQGRATPERSAPGAGEEADRAVARQAHEPARLAAHRGAASGSDKGTQTRLVVVLLVLISVLAIVLLVLPGLSR